jgi:hypothetical protein
MADGMRKDWRDLCVSVINESDSTKLTSFVMALSRRSEKPLAGECRCPAIRVIHWLYVLSNVPDQHGNRQPSYSRSYEHYPGAVVGRESPDYRSENQQS